MEGGGEEEAEALALRSLLDEYEAIEMLGCLSPLGDGLDPLGDGAAERQLASDGDNAAARVTTSGPDDAAKRADTARPSTKRADSNRARNERRFEVVHLRRQASELEGQLEEIRHKEKRRWRPLAIDTDGVYPGRESLQLTHSSMPCLVPRPDETWMEAAEEQRAKRQRAETDNTRLRLLVSDHLKTTAKLKRLLMPKRTRYALQGLGVHIDDSQHDKEATTETSAASGTAVQAEATVLVLAPTVFATTFGVGSAMDTAQVFDMLTRSLDRARSNLDAVFAANGLAGTEKTYRRAKVEQDEANGTVMELVSNKLLPYTMEATQAVAWRHFRDSLPQMPDRAFFKYRDPRKTVEFNGVDDMLADSYSIEIGNGFVSAKFDEWRVIRQFEEPDRVIIIYCLMTETTEFASEPVSGIRILEETSIVLRRPRDNPSHTLMQSCYRLQPIQYKPTPDLDHTVAALTDFLFGFTGGRISINYQMIERALRTSAAR